jgi:predicted MFS family arabinose efflux permease
VSWRQAFAFAVVLGLVAAGAVWFLERFEVAKLHGEVSSYLERYDRFKLWERENEGEVT